MNNSLRLAIFVIASSAFLAFAGFAIGQSVCPSNTTVSGNSVTFVGQVTDMGGASVTYVWFDYGQTQNYGQTTPQQSVNQTGLYCTSASNLSSCTTYHYRAVAQNSAGTSYGNDKTFTTTCSSPSVNLLVNGSAGPITVPYGSSVNLSWTSTNVTSCTASGNWTGSRAISGSETQSNINSYETFTLTCTGGGGTVSDSVSVNTQGNTSGYPVANAGPDLNVSANSSAILQGTGYNSDGTAVSYSWNCNGGTLSNYNIAQPTFYAPNVSYNTNYTCTLTVTNQQGLTAADSANVLVNAQAQVGTLTVNKQVRNLSNGTIFANSVTAAPGDVVSFSIAVTAGNSAVQNVIVKDNLPAHIAWRINSLEIDGVATAGNITSGVSLGTLSAGQTRTVTFEADVEGASNFNFGQTQLTDTATAYNSQTSASDNATILVTRSAVEGTSTATNVTTGITNNIWVDSLALPLAAALIIIFLFKSRILKWEEWMDDRKKQYKQYKSGKNLDAEIMKAKIDEITGKK